MEPNPYESPQVAQTATGSPEPKVPETFFAWERLRVWYNAILVVAVLLASIPAPQWMLCREDCAGLCAVCGADLNEGPCEHVRSREHA